MILSIIDSSTFITINEIKSAIYNTIHKNQFFQGGMIITASIAIVAMLKPVGKSLIDRIKRLIFFKVRINSVDDLYYYFEQYLYQNYESKYRNVEASIQLKPKESKNDDDLIDHEETVFFKQYQDAFIIRRGIHFINICKNREKIENASNKFNRFTDEFIITGILCKTTITKFVEEVQQQILVQKIEKEKTTVNVYTNTTWGECHLESAVKPKNIDQIFIDDLEHIVEDIKHFISSEKLYSDRNIMWKRGLMFYGKPGNGKTALMLALSVFFKKTIYFLNLTEMNDDNLRRVYRSIKQNSIVVYEDVDALFVKRDNETKTEISFSTLLNCIDGAFSKYGIITIFTTNHPELLDPALVRSGRIDLKHEFKNPSKEIVCKYLHMHSIIKL